MTRRLLIFIILVANLSLAQSRIDISSQSYLPVPNDGTTGTTVNQLAKVNTSGNAVNAATTDTAIPVYIVMGGAGTTGNAQLAVGGAIPCKFDASGGTSGHWVTASTTTAGTCHDAGATLPTTSWTFGFLLTSPGANANGTVMLLSGFMQGAGGGGSFTGGTLTSELILAASTTGAASLNITSGTAPTSPVAGDVYRDANGITIVESTTTNGSQDVRSDQAGSVGPANTVRYTADANVAKYSENGGALQEVVGRTKTQTVQNKTLDGTDSVPRAALSADGKNWSFVGFQTATAVASIAVTASPAFKHYMVRLIITSYAGGGGVVRVELGNTTTVDTGTNYSFGGFNIASGNSAAPTVTGIGSGATAQEGVPVSGSTTTAGRFVQINLSNPGAFIKYLTIETSGVGASAAVTPNLAHIAGTWNNTTSGIGILQFKGCSATTGACSTINWTGTVTVWGRNDD